VSQNESLSHARDLLYLIFEVCLPGGHRLLVRIKPCGHHAPKGQVFLVHRGFEQGGIVAIVGAGVIIQCFLDA